MALTGKTSEERIWNYLIKKLGNAYGVAGLMGNLYAESALKSNNLENLCEQRLKENGKSYCTDEKYTAAVDSGQIGRAEFLNPLPGKQYGYGLAQWTSPGRKGGLYDLVKERKVSISDEQAQLDFLISELKNSYPTVLKTLKSAGSVKEASDIVLTKFEMPADCGTSVKNLRASYGQKYYDKYASSSGGSSSSTVADPQKAIAVARNEIGYLEKQSNSGLDNKTDNAGYNNYTKYWRDMANLGLGNYQAQYWCAGFVHWCFYKAYGLAASQKLLLQSFFINCDTMAKLASAAGRLFSSPKVGDVILFYSSSKGYYHTGIVAEVTSTMIKTIEGNTSGGSGVVDNGGCVAEKSYYLSSLSAKFMRPDYSGTNAVETDVPASTPSGTTCKDKGSYSTAEKYVGVVTASELNVRTLGGTSYGTCSFSPLKNGAEVSVCDDVKDSAGDTWYYIKYNGKYGFVHSAYIKKKSGSSSSTPTPSTTKQNKGIVTASSLNVRSWAGTEYPNIKSYPELTKGETVTIQSSLKANDGSTWYKVAINNVRTGYKDIIGFVSAEYIKKQ